MNCEDAGRDADALEHYSKAIEDNPNLLPAYERQANLLIKQNKLNEAVMVLARSLEHTERSASTYYLIGLIEGMQGNWQKSVLNLRQAAELDSDDSNIYIKLALSLAQLWDLTGARNAIATAQNLAPKTPELSQAIQVIDEIETSLNQ